MPKEKQETPRHLEHVAVEVLIPYARNARTHSPEQVAQIAASIREFGFVNPVLIDAKNGIIAGHGRVLAARKLGMASVPCLRIEHLTETQKRAYILADNQLALNAAWDEPMRKVELDDLQVAGFNLELLGFSGEELAGLSSALGESSGAAGQDSTYTNKIIAPVYTPKGEKPPVSALIDRAKTEQLIDGIGKANLPADVAEFMRHAAERHTVFNFRQIAEFYCHANPELQDLMEKSGMVIIDFKKAIENGFVHLTERLGALADIEGAGDDA